MIQSDSGDTRLESSLVSPVFSPVLQTFSPIFFSAIFCAALTSLRLFSIDIVKCQALTPIARLIFLARGFVKVPPLAERPEDIELLASHFLAFRNAHSDRKIFFSRDAMKTLTSHGFDRYNVSELKGLVDQAFEHAIFENEPTFTHLSAEEVVAETAGEGNALATFDEDEKKELATLRRCAFNITAAENRLGYPPGSKMLTNRFRGIVYRAQKPNLGLDAKNFQ